jgi:nucleoside-diphosphate-sugar epimerase
LKILLVGCGDIAQRTATLLSDQHQCVGLKRNPDNLPSIIHPVRADATDSVGMQTILADGYDIVVATLSPDEFTEQAYRQAYLETAQSLNQALSAMSAKPPLVLWISSTSVYGEAHGDWVDENSLTQPETFSGRILLAAEEVIQQLPGAKTVIRFSGIYGPGRTRLLKQVRDGKGRPSQPQLWSNRIHSEDCAGVIAYLIKLYQQGVALQPIYLASDSEPVTQHDIRQWLACQLGIQLEEESAKPGPIRRCSNRSLLESGYQFKYPTYREGYLSLLGDGA